MERHVVVLLPFTALGGWDTSQPALCRLDTPQIKESAAGREVKVDADLACYKNNGYQTVYWFTVSS